MKLSQLRPCDACGGPLGPSFSVVRHSTAIVGLNRQASREVAGLATMFGGNLRIAEAFAPAAEDVVTIFGGKNKQLETELFLCTDCMALSLGGALERRNKEEEAMTRDKRNYSGRSRD